MKRRGRGSGRVGGGEKRKGVKSAESKAAVLKACESVVGVTTHSVAGDGDGVYQGYGLIIESVAGQGQGQEDDVATTIITPAHLFQHHSPSPHLIKVDVCVSGDMYSAHLLACDFHSNLAALRIQSHSPLQTPILRPLNDIISIDVNSHHTSNPFDSQAFKIQSGTEIIILGCSFYPPFSVHAESATFSAAHVLNDDCKELYWVNFAGIKIGDSGVVINLLGEVIGIMFFKYAFLPTNIISRWWSYYKSNGKLCQPWVGVEIVNLAEANLSFLEKFRATFRDVGTGVIVTKVEKDSPAYCCGIRLKDVIVKCDVKRIESKIEFFESIWDNVGKCVGLTVLRTSDGQQLDLNMSIGETPEAHFYRWRPPPVCFNKPL